MKTNKFAILVLACLIFSTPLIARADEGLIKPSSSFYFMQGWGESVRYFFTISADNKITYLLELSQRRVDEIGNDNNSAQITKLTGQYQSIYQKLQQLAENEKNSDLVYKIQSNSTRQQQTLSNVYQKVPEQAQKGILNAEVNSAKHVENTINQVQGEQAADQYSKSVQAIQQVGQKGQVQMESSGPSEDPSKTQYNSINQGQELNQINDTTGGQGQGAAPIQQAAPQSIQ
jgi:hypothetical protein